MKESDDDRLYRLRDAFRETASDAAFSLSPTLTSMFPPSYQQAVKNSVRSFNAFEPGDAEHHQGWIHDDFERPDVGKRDVTFFVDGFPAKDSEQPRIRVMFRCEWLGFGYGFGRY